MAITSTAIAIVVTALPNSIAIYPSSFYQREGFIIQYEGLDEATGEKERLVSVMDMSLEELENCNP